MLFAVRLRVDGGWWMVDGGMVGECKKACEALETCVGVFEWKVEWVYRSSLPENDEFSVVDIRWLISLFFLTKLPKEYLEALHQILI